jgi:hypothetical protein
VQSDSRSDQRLLRPTRGQHSARYADLHPCRRQHARYPGRHPSFAVSLVEPKDQARVTLEYYLAEFDREKLQAPVANRVLPLGEIRYL